MGTRIRAGIPKTRLFDQQPVSSRLHVLRKALSLSSAAVAAPTMLVQLIWNISFIARLIRLHRIGWLAIDILRITRCAFRS
eukprot:639617-Pleurochrysis_carterae.AAC.1